MKLRPYFSRTLSPVLFIAVCISLPSCAGIKGFPTRSYSASDELAALNKYQSIAALQAFDTPDDAARGGMSREGWRNEVLEARIQDMNLQFTNFERSLYEEGVGFGIGADWVTLALNAAGSLVTAGASNALSAASAGVTGGRAAYGKDALYNKTLPVLIAQMVAQRQTVLVRIRGGETQKASDYPLTRGLADLEDYYNAGTIPGAITNLASNAGAQSAEAQAQLDIVTAVSSTLQAKREAVADYVKTLPDSKVTQLAVALKLPGNDLVAVLRAIAEATTLEKLNVITSEINTRFGKEF